MFRSDLRNVRAPVRVVHDVTRFVDRPLAETRLPLSRSVSAAYVDLVANTPFRSEDVEIGLCSDWPSCYFIFRHRDLAGIRKALGPRRQNVSIAVEHEGTIHAIDQRFLAGRPVRSQADRLQRAILFASVLVLILGAALIVTIEQRRLSAADRALSAQVEIASASARAAKEQFDQQMRTLARMDAVRAEKNLSNSVVATWEELSRIIPDNTWVGDLQLTDDRLTVTGFSGSAAALISLLESSERFDGAEFKAPVARTPGLDAEQFSMEASVVRRAAP
ncbi:PilN domain-containing protein [Oricola sp.]|uniref:PilN domain-containing protein n=1 Tax=Oricola sp. TaxID=1979950 RepID=UPI0025DD376D|nr:PilN domain-containing protein [Oricola sp.]MCI5075341.1 PilN domain-containing protein [Oricola sp.]